MTPYYSDDWLTLYGGDCRDVLASLPSDSVDCVVTSPPYWGLRDYGTGTWEGGDPDCKHRVGGQVQDTKWSGAITTGQRPGVDASRCRDCGAQKRDSQLGLERTPEEYVANMVAVFREVRRVLKPSGTCWLNLGDSYNSPMGGAANPGISQKGTRVPTYNLGDGYLPDKALKKKDLVGIPWRVAFALQADGWYLRSDIIWAKPNPMPESVTDRPTKSHEYLFLLTKQSRYYFDSDAVREPNVGTFNDFPSHARVGNGTGRPRYDTNGDAAAPSGHVGTNPAGRNIRSVWTIATRPYPGAHFAVFPPELPERCIKAGSSEKGVCPECGAPWERVVDVERKASEANRLRKGDGARPGPIQTTPGIAHTPENFGVIRKTTGWRPQCIHGMSGHAEGDTLYVSAPSVPAVILDPFGGSGTVGMVANRLSRRAILIDLNPEYLKQQLRRNSQVPLGLTEGDAA